MSGTFDPILVALSVVIAMLASYAALDLAGRVSSAVGNTRVKWLAVGASVMGIGIWSMHFVGMLAFNLPVPMGFGLSLMLLSVVVAIGASLLALLVVSRPELGWRTMSSAGLLMGVAIAGMHYIGMASMQVPARLTYTPTAVILSVVIAVVASIAALWLAFRFRSEQTARGKLLKALSAVVMGVAIAGMHYTGMAGAHFGPAEPMTMSSGAYVLATDQLAWAVVIGAMFIILLALVGAAYDRNMLRAQLEFREDAEASLRESEEYFRTLTENSPEIIVVLNADGTIRDRGGESTPMRANQSEGGKVESIFDHIHPDDCADAQRTLEMSLRHPGETQSVILRGMVDGEGWRTFEAHATNLVDHPPVSGIVVNCLDITNRVKLEEQLRQASKMEGLGRLAGGVAHDFNNLLTVIRGNSEALLADRSGDANGIEELREIHEAAERAASLTRQLLTFSRQQVLEPRAINLNESITDMKDMLTRLIGEHIEIVTQLDSSLGWTMLDPTQVEQVILNLAVNARDAMPGGGQLLIETRNVELSGDGAQPDPTATAGRFVRLAVTDNGHGIHPEVLPHIFEPFFTTKLLGNGTGLGLATVYGVVQQAGGHIRVVNGPSSGTEFQVDFPRTDAAAQPKEVSEVTELPPKGTQTILVTEDQSPVRRILKKGLGRLGYTVLEADGGEQALRIIAEHPGVIHLLLTDVLMPKMGGVELARRASALRPQMKIAFISGYINDGLTRDAMLGPGTVFIEKPFDSLTLARKVAEALE
jgi:PAS domain S-box-containing protein